MADLVVSITRFNLVYEAAKSLISSIYKRFVTFAPMGFESLYPSAAFIFQAIGFKQTVNCLAHKVSPGCKPLLNLIGSEVSRPCLVVTTILVFQLLHNLPMVSPNLWWETYGGPASRCPQSRSLSLLLCSM